MSYIESSVKFCSVMAGTDVLISVVDRACMLLLSV